MKGLAFEKIPLSLSSSPALAPTPPAITSGLELRAFSDSPHWWQCGGSGGREGVVRQMRLLAGGEGSRAGEMKDVVSLCFGHVSPRPLLWPHWSPCYSCILLHFKAFALVVLSLPGIVSPGYIHPGLLPDFHQLSHVKHSLNRKASLTQLQTIMSSFPLTFPLTLLSCSP